MVRLAGFSPLRAARCRVGPPGGPLRLGRLALPRPREVPGRSPGGLGVGPEVPGGWFGRLWFEVPGRSSGRLAIRGAGWAVGGAYYLEVPGRSLGRVAVRGAG